MKALIFGLLVLFTTFDGYAQPESCGGPVACALSFCKTKAPNLELPSCLWVVYSRLDEEMDRIYAAALTSIDNKQPENEREKWKEALKKSQWLWVQFRDQDCREVMQYEWWKASGEKGASALCMIGQTVKRTEIIAGRYGLKNKSLAFR